MTGYGLDLVCHDWRHDAPGDTCGCVTLPHRAMCLVPMHVHVYMCVMCGGGYM